MNVLSRFEGECSIPRDAISNLIVLKDHIASLGLNPEIVVTRVDACRPGTFFKLVFVAMFET